jgi:hypothetical protein
MAELSAGVRALVGRMESNPSEFYGEAEKWRFMFSANFRDVLTEPEKGALHEALKEVRRKEFDEKVMRELLKDNMENQIKEGYYTSPQISNGGTGFNPVQIGNGSGGVISNVISTTGTTSLQIGDQKLSEEDVKQMKAATTSSNLFK